MLQHNSDQTVKYLTVKSPQKAPKPISINKTVTPLSSPKTVVGINLADFQSFHSLSLIQYHLHQ